MAVSGSFLNGPGGSTLYPGNWSTGYAVEEYGAACYSTIRFACSPPLRPLCLVWVACWKLGGFLRS